MEIGRTFSFITEDEEWVSKILIGALISLIPIVGMVTIYGYMLQVARNVALGHERPLPRWDEFGMLLIRGVHFLVVGLVYQLPLLVLALLFACVAGAMGATIGSADEAESTIGAMIGLISCVSVPLMIILSLGGAALTYVGLARYLAEDRLAAAFELGEVIALLRGQSGLWLLLLVAVIVASLVAPLGVIACGVGVLATTVFAICMQGHALGQVIRAAGLLGQPGAAPHATPPTIQL